MKMPVMNPELVLVVVCSPVRLKQVRDSQNEPHGKTDAERVAIEMPPSERCHADGSDGEPQTEKSQHAEFTGGPFDDQEARAPASDDKQQQTGQREFSQRQAPEFWRALERRLPAQMAGWWADDACVTL